MPQLRLGTVSLFHFFALVLLVVLAGIWWGDGKARAEEAPPGFSPAEQYVLEQAAAGNVANLRNRFPDEQDRVLSSAFLEKLLTGGFKEITIHRRGVQIQYAVFDEPLDLRNAEVPHETRLDDSQFNNRIDLSGSCFARSLSFEGSKFKATANFNGMKVGDVAFFRKAVFAGPVDFGGAEITSNFRADGVEFKNARATANFNSMKVGHAAFFRKAVFAGAVNFIGAEITSQFLADDAEFKNAKAKADFDGMKVGRIAFFRKAVFAGPVRFRGAEITDQFVADEAEFKNAKAKADFDGMKVGRTAFFRKAVFAGAVDFSGAEIIGNLRANEAQFNHPEAEANFNGMKVGGAAFFEKAVFAGPANFGRAKITGRFMADGAEFKNAKEEANFNGMKVGGTAFFEKAVFAGPVDFGRAEITGRFMADGAKFKHAKAEANFNGMKVGGGAFLRKAVFAGPVNFLGAEIRGQFIAEEAEFKQAETTANFNGIKVSDIALFQNTVFEGLLSIAEAELLDLIIQGSREKGPSVLKSLDLSRTAIQRKLVIEDAQLGELMAPSLQVAGPTTLNRVRIEQATNLEHARFLTLTLTEVTWPGQSDSVRLEGMTYEHISAGEKEGDWKKLLEWIDGAAYNTQPYSQLEASFRADGYPERTDAVYVALKQRERREVLPFSSLGWWKNVLLEKLVRYGRSAHWALYWSALVVFIGVLVFARRKDVEPRKAEDTSRPYNPLWYSLDLFLPFVPLEAAEVWMPRQDSRFRRHYARLHTILGWMLIPIGLAAITGIIK